MKPNRNSRWYRAFYSAVNGVCKALDKVYDGAATTIEGVDYAWSNAKAGVVDAATTKISEVPPPRVSLNVQDFPLPKATIHIDREGNARIINS